MTCAQFQIDHTDRQTDGQINTAKSTYLVVSSSLETSDGRNHGTSMKIDLYSTVDCELLQPKQQICIFSPLLLIIAIADGSFGFIDYAEAWQTF